MAKSFAVEVVADDTGKFIGNGLRFADFEQAELWGRDLAGRWSAVRKWRVVASDEPVNRPLVEA